MNIYIDINSARSFSECFSYSNSFKSIKFSRLKFNKMFMLLPNYLGWYFLVSLLSYVGGWFKNCGIFTSVVHLCYTPWELIHLALRLTTLWISLHPHPTRPKGNQSHYIFEILYIKFIWTYDLFYCLGLIIYSR